MFTVSLRAQRGGESVFGLLHLTHSARMTSLGGNQVGLEGHDLSMLIHNPAMLDSVYSQQLSMSFVPYMAGINYGFGGFALTIDKIGNFAVGFLHAGYGSFVGADEYGVKTGDFRAGESALQITYSKEIIPRLTAGISVIPIYSHIESYSAWGVASDIGLFYRQPNNLFSAGIVLRNLGRQITAYHEGPRESMAADLQLGISTKLEHAPFRFSLTFQDLLSGSLQYETEDKDQLRLIYGDDRSSDSDSFFQKMSQYLTVGFEFLPTDNFYLAVGMNPRRRQELKIASKPSTVGFSWGFGFRFNRFDFSYGSTRYHLGGTSNHFSVSTNLTSF